MKLFVTIWIVLMFIVLFVLASNPQCQADTQVTYTVVSDRNDAPTFVTYRSSTGGEMYDSLNWGNRDGDTLPWSLTVNDAGTPHVRAQFSGRTQPWPTYGCVITMNGARLSNTGVGTVDCEVRS